ncbi:MAG TPA: sulfotransferase [Rhizomicrobium sp.]|nr:sulfotransferase [Rhizomicrobium sp.]
MVAFLGKPQLKFKQVKAIYLVSQSGAGRYVFEKLTRAVLGDAARWCAGRGLADCCLQQPCRRAAEFERAGYRLHVQPEPEAADAASDSPIVILVREPTTAALLRYERFLRSNGRKHAIELLENFLATEAAQRVAFWRKWLKLQPPRSVILRFEDLIAAPREAMERILSGAGVQYEDRELGACAHVELGAAPAATLSKSVESNPYFVRHCLEEYLNVLAEETDYLGYPPWREPKPASGPVATLFRARMAFAAKNYEEAVSLLTGFIATNPVEQEVRAMLGEALLHSEREVEGRRTIEAILRADPDFFSGYGILAAHAYDLGLVIEARGYLREAARRGGQDFVRKFFHGSRIDPELAAEFAEPSEPPIRRDDVVGGYNWLLGREPESEEVIEEHRRLEDVETLRGVLLRSEEFKNFFERRESGQYDGSDLDGGPLSRADMLAALRWILGRAPRSSQEAAELLALGSRGALRLRLVASDEFLSSYRFAAAVA